MKTRFLLKNRVQKLRRGGLSLNEISNRLHIKKGGSLSVWVRDIHLTTNQQKRLKARALAGGIKGSKHIQKKRNSIRKKEIARLRKEALREIGLLTKRELFILGVGIYWSEGYTYSTGEQVGFTNSDPQMVLLMLKWFTSICDVLRDNITLHVKVNSIHKNRVSEIENYWSRFTRIPISQFTNTTILKTKPKKKYMDDTTYYGTLRITIRQGTSLRRKIHGWIEGLTRNI